MVRDNPAHPIPPRPREPRKQRYRLEGGKLILQVRDGSGRDGDNWRDATIEDVTDGGVVMESTR